MSYSQDTWLDSLIKHSIFELNQQEKLVVQSLEINQTRQQPVTDFILQHHNRVIALRDNDLFVAVGKQIRVLNLTEFKDTWVEVSQEVQDQGIALSENWIHSVPYKVLDTPEINFYIESMVPNINGRLLAVTGNSGLVIVCLPRQGFSDVSHSRRKIDCRTLSIGTKYYDFSRNEILKVEWHPLSETRTHIVVLGSDNMLRIFDVSVDIEEPEQTFDLSPNEKSEKSSQGGFSLDDDESGEEDAVTFSLGNISRDTSGWEPFTVFYALRSGHIYSLCPVIPFKSIIRRGHLDNLSCLSQVKYEQSKSNNKTLSHLFSLHNQWIKHLFESAKIGTKGLDSDSLTVFSSDEHIPYPVQRQGPFLISHTNPLDDGIEATDLLFSNVGPISILSLALNNGTLHNYIIGSEIDAQWQLPVKNAKNIWQSELAHLLSDADFLPRASLYEVLKLKSENTPPFQRVTLVNDPLYKDTYYAYHAGGVHVISMNKWVQQLADLSNSFEEGKSTEGGINNWLNQKITSDVRQLVNSSPLQSGFVPIVGFVLIKDMYLSYSSITLTSDYRAVTRDMNMRHDRPVSKESQNAVKEQLKYVGDAESKYQPLLSLPAFQPPKQLDGLPKQAKIIIPPNMGGSKDIVITEESLRFFAKSSEQIRRETHDLKKAAVKIDSRLLMQQKEFEKQVTDLRDLYDRLQLARSADIKAGQEQKLKELHQTHAKLRLRIDEQLRKLMHVYQPDLSNEEKDWIAKLEKIAKQVGGESGYDARIKQLKDQLEQISLKSSKKPKTTVSNINATQLNNVLRTLKEQKSSITDVKHRVEIVTNKLPSTVA
ncbi:hypothetical protein INT47_012242 [Mucor saturninus]|uniref:Uncharacterized protein n=1 Tax=Mucor saturninus TaxID=64648 RepID=A0A8H7VAF7_9FUNG|nr:hypothetical protein INT47_012242 [Mucor saturninus]